MRRLSLAYDVPPAAAVATAGGQNVVLETVRQRSCHIADQLGIEG